MDGAQRARDSRAAGPMDAAYRVVTVGIVAIVSLVAFEALAVSTAMPVVADDLGGVRSYGLAFSLFLTTTLLGTVLAGGWSDARGPRGPAVAGLVLFAGGLLVSGLASTFGWFLLGRVVAGAGGGFFVVALYVVVARAYPEELRPRVFGWISAAWVLPSVVGPPLAGWLAEEVSWRVVFLLVPPLVVPTLLALMPRMSVVAGTRGSGGTRIGAGGDQDVERGSVRPVRRAVAGTGLAGGATLAQWGGQELTRGGTAAALAVAGGLVLVAATLPTLLPPGTLRVRRGLPSVVAARGLFTASFFAAETFVPLMLVAERGLHPLLAGLSLTGGAVGWAVGSWLQGRARMRRHRHRLLAAGGLVVAAATAALPLAVLPAVTPWLVLPVWLVAGVGMGLGMTISSVLVLDLSLQQEQGRSSASLQVADGLGGVLGIGAAGAVFAALHDPRGDDGDVYTLMWLALGVVAVAAAAVGRRTLPS